MVEISFKPQSCEEILRSLPLFRQNKTLRNGLDARALNIRDKVHWRKSATTYSYLDANWKCKFSKLSYKIWINSFILSRLWFMGVGYRELSKRLHKYVCERGGVVKIYNEKLFFLRGSPSLYTGYRIFNTYLVCFYLFFRPCTSSQLSK